jgi:hypothetical protein
MDQPFLQFSDLILPPPLPAVVSILCVLGFVRLGNRLVRVIRGDAAELPDRAAGFICACGGVAALIHAAAAAQLASPPNLRVPGGVLVVCGLMQALEWRRIPAAIPRRIAETWNGLDLPGRLISAAAALILLGLTATALGPVHDEDSLDYHLAVPLEWLRHGGALPLSDFMSARLVGLGENLNLLGLALGTDSLGAALQMTGIPILLAALWPFGQSSRDRSFAAIAVLACPVVIALSTAQKPQLQAIAAVVLALAMLYRRTRILDRGTLVLAIGCCAFAIACKHSFLLSAGIVMALAFLLAARRQITRVAILSIVASLSILALPIYIRNIAWYSDPVSPMMEGWKANPEPAVIALRDFIYDLGHEPHPHQRPLVALDMVATAVPGRIRTVLGIGILAFLPALKSGSPARSLLLFPLLFCAAWLPLGQLSSRFFFEAYLAAAAAAVASPWSLLKRLLYWGLGLQALVVIVLVWFSAITFFPAALVPAWRERIMTRSVVGFADAQWIERNVPRGHRILATTWAHLFLPRPYASMEYAIFLEQSGLPLEARRDLLLQQIERHGLTAVVVDYSANLNPLLPIKPYCAGYVGKPGSVPSPVTNPFKNGAPRKIAAFELKVP